MLFRMDRADWCHPAVPAQSVEVENLGMLALLVAVVWVVVGLGVACLDYWALDDDEVEGADPIDPYDWLRLAGTYLLTWPAVLLEMRREWADARLVESYRAAGGQGCDE